MRICAQYALTPQLPVAVLDHLQRGFAGKIPDTPKPGDTCFASVHNHLIGSAALSAKEAAATLQQAGCDAHIFSNALQGEARDVARSLLHEQLPALLAKHAPAQGGMFLCVYIFSVFDKCMHAMCCVMRAMCVRGVLCVLILICACA